MPRNPRGRPRTTPREIDTPAVVAAIRALGEASAAEVAEAVSLAAGVRVSGRAVRFLAENAGARGITGTDGVRRYWMPLGVPDRRAEDQARGRLGELRGAVAAGHLDAAAFPEVVTRAAAALALDHPGAVGERLGIAFRERARDIALMRDWPMP